MLRDIDGFLLSNHVKNSLVMQTIAVQIAHSYIRLSLVYKIRLLSLSITR